MGTRLGTWFTDGLAPHATRVVFGTGAGKDRHMPVLTEEWHVYGVRGPLTASFLDLDSSLVLTDPAMAIRDFADVRQPARRGIGFMPHYFSVADWDWRKTCAQLGLVYVDPHQPAVDTLRQLAGLEKLLTEELKIDQAARLKISSQRKIILEGSQEWDILYRKFYNDEVKKLGL